ncbi:DUF2243 domain-containing protein [Rubellimicrobium aerolatum]|uniref:DUF2243 domain-containing protein n=1 Tax=Rubellimicrobium aerolatum TaxID=490979 RepID=A0ABW0S853_9RHOB|nr:DUF2243 domain-containing protein [Rubellimicrobium aerolatum]MBP1804361.1 putative membrane protein [Rubellimicrobium aerolatum]
MGRTRGSSRGLVWAGVLGFALSGFFDGILLHQILQWHHLLSLVPGVDLREQVLWDGLFHALMYVLAALALAGLWRAGRAGAMPLGARLGGALLLGFGGWHLVDAVLSHWMLGIHRIRVESEVPLAWDLLWLGAFGLAPMALGWALLRRGGGRPGRGGAALAALGLLAVGLGGWGLRPGDGPYTVAVFGPGLAPGRIAADLEALGATVVWAGPEMDVVVLDLPADRRWALYGRGAWLVGGAGLPVGCVGWSRA